MTYAELQTQIAAWLHRKDLTAQIPTFIALAESRMHADVHSRETEAVASLTASANVPTIALPDDLYEMRRVRLLGIWPRVLGYQPLETLLQGREDGAAPCHFTVIGSSLQLAPVPDKNYGVEIIYQRRIEALSNTTTTNILLQRWPDLYLYGALACAQPFLQDDARGQVHEALYQRAVAQVNAPSRHSGAPLQVRSA